MTESTQTGLLANIKVLLVEDDVFFSDIVLTKLSQHGCVPYLTADGSQALDMTRQHLPDVILLDLMLPGLSGEEILLRLKAEPDLSRIPVIICSNKSNQSDIDTNLSNGAVKYIVKSALDFAELPTIVATVANAATENS